MTAIPPFVPPNHIDVRSSVDAGRRRDDGALRPVREYHELESAQEGQALGYSLPIGLRLLSDAADPGHPVQVPGDPERATRHKYAAGIPVEEETFDMVVDAAGKLGIEVPGELVVG